MVDKQKQVNAVCELNDKGLTCLRLEQYDEAGEYLNDALNHVRRLVSGMRLANLVPECNKSIRNPICIGTIEVPIQDDNRLEYYNRGFVLSEGSWVFDNADVYSLLFFLTFNRALVLHQRGLQSARNEKDLRQAQELYKFSLCSMERGHEMYGLDVHDNMLLVGYMAACENNAHLHRYFACYDEARYFHSYFLKAFVFHFCRSKMTPSEAHFFSFRAHVASEPRLFTVHSGAA